jgi:hypothetical protein
MIINFLHNQKQTSLITKESNVFCPMKNNGKELNF